MLLKHLFVLVRESWDKNVEKNRGTYLLLISLIVIKILRPTVQIFPTCNEFKAAFIGDATLNTIVAIKIKVNKTQEPPSCLLTDDIRILIIIHITGLLVVTMQSFFLLSYVIAFLTFPSHQAVEKNPSYSETRLVNRLIITPN